MSIDYPKILYLFSAPLVAPDGKPLDALDMKAELEAILHELPICKREGSLRIAVASICELARSVEEEFNILLVSSHGHEEFLLFEDGKGGSEPVTGDYLRNLIRTRGSFELAIVSACYSEKIAAMLVEAGIPHVVAVMCDVPVLDRAAIVFIGQFLRSLFHGDSVRKAFEMATLVVEGNPELMKMKRHLEYVAYRKRELYIPEEKKFVLLPLNTAHSDAPFSQEILEGTLKIDNPPSTESNLPVKPQTFTGRSAEMHDIIGELCTHRFVTVTGVGGIGKTTLAIEVARWFSSRNHFPDGIFWIDLRQVTAERIIPLLGATFDVQGSELRDVITYLKTRTCLLLLDNAEDILWQNEGALQEIIDNILRFTPHTRLLITSQRPCGGNLDEPEHVYRIYSLQQDYAAFLFFDTTRRRMTKKELKSQTFSILLRKLGGHPLSIVLTARQLTPGMTLEDIYERIEVYKAKAINVKNITDRNMEHGESLVASLASAYDILSDRAKIVFEILSLLPAGAKKDILEEICGKTVWGHIRELNDASLVEVRDNRCTLLPPVRLFAMTLLTEDVEKQFKPRIMEVMAAYAQKLCEHHGTKGAKEYRLFFTADEPNLRFAVDLPCQPSPTENEPSLLGKFGPFLIQMYIFHNRWKEAREVGNRILANLKRLQDRTGEANTLTTLGMLAFRTGSLEEAKTQYEKALEIYQRIDVKLWEANALWALGNLSMRFGILDEAQNQYEKALQLYQYTKRNLGEANTLMHLGDLAMWRNNFDEAQNQYEKALQLYQHIKRNLGEANTLMHLGDLAMWRNNFDEAQNQYEKALQLYQHLEVKDGEARILTRMAQRAGLAGELDHAETNLSRVFTLYRDIEDFEGLADAHLVRALIYFAQRNMAKAKRELDFCSSILNRINAHGEAARWLTLYAAHWMLQGIEEGAVTCLEYAEEFVSKTRNQHLRNQVSHLKEMVKS
ncbi:MAG: tetratricopeptide repeat protein [Theionarchaea archaeon]|nr:tetratricopeptide repeat protein [Theionarchaea archaeon]